MRRVSGLWQYRQRSGQPARKVVSRVPGPSTAVTSSQECREPISPARTAARCSLRSISSAVASPAVPAERRSRGTASSGTATYSPLMPSGATTPSCCISSGACTAPPSLLPATEVPRSPRSGPLGRGPPEEDRGPRDGGAPSDPPVEGAGDDVQLLLAREPDEVDRVPGDPDGQLGVLLGVLHGVLEGVPVEHVDVHVEAL